MTIKVGDKIPSATVFLMTQDGPKGVSTEELFAGKKIVMFAVPGAFTPTCSQAHLPGYVVHADTLKAKGVDAIYCLSVNDPFVMKAWSQASNAEAITMLADGNGSFTKALGLEMDVSGAGLGIRSQRFALIADNGVVSLLNIEAPKEFKVSDAETILKALD